MVYFDNWKKSNFLEEIIKSIQNSKSIQIVSGYVSESGIRLLEYELKEFITRGGDLRLVVGMPCISGITRSDISALMKLNSYEGNNRQNRVKVAVTPTHSK